MKDYEKDPKSFPDQFETYRMKVLATDFLKKNGYKEGPIGWFSKNASPKVYSDRWSSGVPLIGFGIGAYSYTDNVQYRNIKDPDLYRYYVNLRNELPISTAAFLDDEMQLKKKISFYLKQMQNIELDVQTKTIFADLIDRKGLFNIKDNKLNLTEVGSLMVEEIISGYIWKDVKIFFSH